MGQNSSAQNQQSSGSPFGGRPRESQADKVKRLQTALALAATNESNLKSEIETLKTSLTHALSSEREMRASARDTREEWERVERALREEIGVLRVGLVDTEKTLAKVKKELQGKKVVPFVQRLIKGKGRLVEEMITLEEPPQNVCAEVDEESVTSFSGWLPPRSRILIITFRSLEGSSEIHVLFDGLALHHFEQHDPFSVPKTGPSAFRTKLAPDLAALERATAGLQRAVNAELRSAHVKTSSTVSSTSIPKAARNLRLLVVLWEEGGKEKLMSSLMSVVGEPGPKMYTGDCLICTEPLTREETVSVEGCGHTTCKDCLCQHITSRLGEKVWPILCPICVAERGSQRKAQGMACSFDSCGSRSYSQMFYSDNTAPSGRTCAATTCLEPMDRLRTVSICRACRLSKVRPFLFLLVSSLHPFPSRCSKPNLFELLDYNRSNILICTHGCECAWCRDCSRRVSIEAPHDCEDAALDDLAGERSWMRCPRPSTSRSGIVIRSYFLT